MENSIIDNLTDTVLRDDVKSLPDYRQKEIEEWFDNEYKNSFSLDNVNLELLKEVQNKLNMENKMKATRYCLDKETEKGYSEMFRESKVWRCGLIDPDGLLKLPKSPSFEFKDDKCELPVEGSMFYQREEDLENIPESTLSVSGNDEQYIIERKIEFQTSVTLQQAVEKLCEELKSDEDYYRSWKD